MTTKKSAPKKRVAVKKGGTKKKKTSSTKKKSSSKKKKVVAVEDLDVHQPAAIPLMMYRRIAVTFTLLVAAALVIVLYLSTVQAVIHVDSTQEAIATEFITTVSATPVRDTEIEGTVLSGMVSDTATYVPSGAETKEESGTARGTVTIYNNMSTAQPLVATTRFLSPEGVLFRLEDGVTVPAGGSVQAEVYADEEGKEGDIAPTIFTIPGLSQAKQELVYAESAEAFTGGVTYISVLSQDEITASVETLKESLSADAKNMLTVEANNSYSEAVFDYEIIEQNVSAEAGDEVDAYEVTLQIRATGVFYEKESLAELARAKLYENIGQGQRFVNVDPSKMVVRVDDVDVEDQRAAVHVTLAAVAITSETSEALDVSRFIGMTEEEVRDTLIEEGIASGVDVEFFPFWIDTIPRLKDHIYINIE